MRTFSPIGRFSESLRLRPPERLSSSVGARGPDPGHGRHHHEDPQPTVETRAARSRRSRVTTCTARSRTPSATSVTTTVARTNPESNDEVAGESDSELPNISPVADAPVADAPVADPLVASTPARSRPVRSRPVRSGRPGRLDERLLECRVAGSGDVDRCDTRRTGPGFGLAAGHWSRPRRSGCPRRAAADPRTHHRVGQRHGPPTGRSTRRRSRGSVVSRSFVSRSFE